VASKRLSDREWVEKYKPFLQNEEIINLTDLPNLPTTQLGAWSFIKLACIWSYARYTYTPIIGRKYYNMCYVDLFSGSGLMSFRDGSKGTHQLLGSPILMATMKNEFPFRKCYFFEKEKHEALSKRLEILKNNRYITTDDYTVFPSDCNQCIDDLIDELSKLEHAHFLLFVDPYSTEIQWSTMEKLLSLEYPAFDMFFNFQPFGINRKSYRPETFPNFFGEDGYELYERYLTLRNEDHKLEKLKDYYVSKLREFDVVGHVDSIKISSGTCGYYYDLIYTTRISDPKWAAGITHLANKVENITGSVIQKIFDPTVITLDRWS